MAAPVAAGVVALVAAQNPDWSGLQVGSRELLHKIILLP